MWLPVGLLQIEAFVIYGEKGGGQVEIFTRDPLIFGCFYQEDGSQVRVWGVGYG